MEKEINVDTLDAVAKAASAAYEMAEREGLLKKRKTGAISKRMTMPPLRYHTKQATISST